MSWGFLIVFRRDLVYLLLKASGEDAGPTAQGGKSDVLDVLFDYWDPAPFSRRQCSGRAPLAEMTGVLTSPNSAFELDWLDPETRAKSAAFLGNMSSAKMSVMEGVPFISTSSLFPHTQTPP